MSLLKVPLDYGPANHIRARGAGGRLGGWLYEVLAELCTAWPLRWDEYVVVPIWIHLVEPDESARGNVSPYRVLLSRDPRTSLEDLASKFNNCVFGQGFERAVEERTQQTREILDTLTQRQANKNSL